MAKPLRFLGLTPEEDQTLRELELRPVVNAKVRLRASIIRLNGAGWTAPKLSKHFGRNLQSIHNDLDVLDKAAPSGPVRHRSPANFAVNLLAGLIAYTHQPKKPSLRLPADLVQRQAIISG